MVMREQTHQLQTKLHRCSPVEVFLSFDTGGKWESISQVWCIRLKWSRRCTQHEGKILVLHKCFWFILSPPLCLQPHQHVFCGWFFCCIVQLSSYCLTWQLFDCHSRSSSSWNSEQHLLFILFGLKEGQTLKELQFTVKTSIWLCKNLKQV